jgi:cytoskeletal protein RodZ
MTEGLKPLGLVFRQKRKELNYSLKEVENATSIRTNHLNAIEDGEMKKLISPVYAEGFVKQYAIFLGMDGEKIIKDNPEVFLKGSQNQEFSYGIGTLELRQNPGAGVKFIPNVVWVGAFVAVLGLAWFFAKFLEVI